MMSVEQRGAGAVTLVGDDQLLPRFGVGVAGRFLHVAQRHAGVQGGGDERMTKRARTDPLGDAGCSSSVADLFAALSQIGPR